MSFLGDSHLLLRLNLRPQCWQYRYWDHLFRMTLFPKGVKGTSRALFTTGSVWLICLSISEKWDICSLTWGNTLERRVCLIGRWSRERIKQRERYSIRVIPLIVMLSCGPELDPSCIPTYLAFFSLISWETFFGGFVI